MNGYEYPSFLDKQIPFDAALVAFLAPDSGEKLYNMTIFHVLEENQCHGGQ